MNFQLVMSSMSDKSSMIQFITTWVIEEGDFNAAVL